jgi:hypothetical protein
MSDRGSRLLRNVRPGMVILDDLGVWQKVTRVETAGGYTTLWLEDGSDEEGPSGDRVQVRESAPVAAPAGGEDR